MEEISRTFVRFDEDLSGKISRRNLKRAAHELGEDLTEAELRVMIEAYDADFDGQLSLEEFKKAMEDGAMT
jgi:centrin-3